MILNSNLYTDQENEIISKASKYECEIWRAIRVPSVVEQADKYIKEVDQLVSNEISNGFLKLKSQLDELDIINIKQNLDEWSIEGRYSIIQYLKIFNTEIERLLKAQSK